MQSVAKTKKVTRTVLQGPQGLTSDEIANLNVFEYLSLCTPNNTIRIAESAMRGCGAHPYMFDDLRQEIFAHWCSLTPDATFAPGEVANYAKVCAHNVGLDYLRNHGSACRLPGNAFRKRPDGTTYVSPGLLTAPIDYAALDSALNADDSHLHPDAVGMPVEQVFDLSPSALNVLIDEASPMMLAENMCQETEVNGRRKELVELAKPHLTKKHYHLLSALLEGKTQAEIAEELSLANAKVMLLLSEASYVLRVVEAGEDADADDFVQSLLKKEKDQEAKIARAEKRMLKGA